MGNINLKNNFFKKMLQLLYLIFLKLADLIFLKKKNIEI